MEVLLMILSFIGGMVVYFISMIFPRVFLGPIVVSLLASHFNLPDSIGIGGSILAGVIGLGADISVLGSK